MANAATTLAPPRPGPGHPRCSASVPRNDALTRAVSQRVALSLVARPPSVLDYLPGDSLKEGTRHDSPSLSLSLSLSRLRAYYLRQISRAGSRGMRLPPPPFCPSPSAYPTPPIPLPAYLLKINWLTTSVANGDRDYGNPRVHRAATQPLPSPYSPVPAVLGGLFEIRSNSRARIVVPSCCGIMCESNGELGHVPCESSLHVDGDRSVTLIWFSNDSIFHDNSVLMID
jgi:hypothetical protein